MSAEGAPGPAAAAAGSFAVSQRVKVAGRPGTVRFCGTTEFAAGIWVGIELDEAVGKNDGTVRGTAYFSCPPEYGIFVRPSNVSPDDGLPTPAGLQRLSVGSQPGKRDSTSSIGSAANARTSVGSASGSAKPVAAAAPPATAAVSPTATDVSANSSPPRVAGSASSDARTSSPSSAAPPTVVAAPATSGSASPPAVAPEPGTAQATTPAPVSASVSASAPSVGPTAATARTTPVVHQANPPQRSSQQASPSAAGGTGTASAATPATSQPRVAAAAVTAPGPVPNAAPDAQRLQELRAKAAELRQELEARRAEAAAQKRQLADAEQRRGAVKEALAKAQNQPSEQERLAVEKLQKAQASRDMMKASVDRTRGELELLQQINKQLEPQQEGETEEDLRSQLQATTHSRMLEEEKLEEMRLELAELELDLEVRAEERAKGACTKGGAPQKALEYQSAVRVLFSASSAEAKQLRERVEELDKACSFEVNLKNERETLSQRQELLYDEITDLEQKDSELEQLEKAGQLLHDTQADIVQELRRELERSDSRVEELENLVQRLYRDWKEVESAIAKDSNLAAELLEQVQVVATEATGEEEVASSAAVHHARQAAAEIKRRLAELGAATATAHADAYTDCIPDAWKPQENSADGGKPSVLKVIARTKLVSRVEHCLCQAAALATHAHSCLVAQRPSEPALVQFCQLGLAGWRCAGAVAGALESIHDDSVRQDDGLEASCATGEKQLGALLEEARRHNACGIQALATLSELAQRFSALCGPEGGDRGTELNGMALTRRTAACFLRRLEVAYNFCLTAAAGSRQLASNATGLNASGASDPVIGPILAGSYAVHGENHGFPAYLKDEKAGADDVNLFFWDERDGPENSGWWFAPVIGGDAVWARAPGDGSPQPPKTGWRVPSNGDVDPGFGVVFHEDHVDEAAQCEQASSDFADIVGRLGQLASQLEAAPSAEAKEIKADAASLLHASLAQPLESFEAALAAGAGTSTGRETLAAAFSDVEKALDALERLNVVDARCRSLGTFYGARTDHFNSIPRWAACAEETSTDVETVFETMQEVASMQVRVQVQQRALGVAEQQLAKASEHSAELQKKLSALCEQAEHSAALDAEAEKLRVEVHRCATAQVALGRELDGVRACREQQEQVGQQASKKREELEKGIEKLRRGPSKEGDVKATPQEYAALRITCEKGSRDLYALQVGAVANLAPLPPLELQRPPSGRAGEACVSKYADLRQDLLLTWARTRVPRLEGAGSAHMDAQLGRIQQLQLKVAEVRGVAAPLAAAATSAAAGRGHEGPAAAGPTSSPAVQLKLQFPCPRWAGLMAPAAKSQLSVTFGELCGIHAAMA